MTFDESSDLDEKVLMDFETSSLIRDLEKYKKSEASVDKAQKLLPATNFDFKGKLKDCLKDRKEGIHIVHEVDDAAQKLSAFVAALETQLAQHHRLIGVLEQARSFYGQQLKDATVVFDAYDKFKGGIDNVKSELEDMLRTETFLGASPPRDAPSPSPVDDPFAEGVEAAIKDLKRPGARDIFEASDMDVDEEEAMVKVPEPSSSADSGPMSASSFQTNQSFIGQVSMEQAVELAVHKPKQDPRLQRMQRAAAAGDATSRYANAAVPNTSEPPPEVVPQQPNMSHPPPGTLYNSNPMMSSPTVVAAGHHPVWNGNVGVPPPQHVVATGPHHHQGPPISPPAPVSPEGIPGAPVRAPPHPQQGPNTPGTPPVRGAAWSPVGRPPPFPPRGTPGQQRPPPRGPPPPHSRHPIFDGDPRGFEGPRFDPARPPPRFGGGRPPLPNYAVPPPQGAVATNPSAVRPPATISPVTSAPQMPSPVAPAGVEDGPKGPNRNNLTVLSGAGGDEPHAKFARREEGSQKNSYHRGYWR